MRPSRRRIIVYVAGLVAGIVVPVAAALLIGALGPAPYLLDEDGLGPEWSSPRRFSDGSTVSVTAFQTPAAANQHAASLGRSIPTTSTSQILNVVRYTRADDRRRGLLLPVDRHIVHVEAADDEAIDARLHALPFIHENPEKNPLFVLFTEHLGLAFAGLALYVAAFGIAMARGGSWAAEIAPRPRTAPVTAKTLRARILALNDLDLPFHVREESDGLVAEWRIADDRWIGLMEAGCTTSTGSTCGWTRSGSGCGAWTCAEPFPGAPASRTSARRSPSFAESPSSRTTGASRRECSSGTAAGR
jgi:hypothetical protein